MQCLGKKKPPGGRRERQAFTPTTPALCDGGASLRRRFTFAASKVGLLLIYYTRAHVASIMQHHYIESVDDCMNTGQDGQ